jgi:L-asparaginase II
MVRHRALAVARVGTGPGLRAGHARAARRLRSAVARHPFMVGGTDRFDTQVMQRLGERVFCKVGAEGVFCAALPERGLGVAIKIDDGNNARAAEVAMAAVIEALVALDDDEAVFMRARSAVTLRNWNGIEVGALRAEDAFRQGLGKG